jgi:hypothetical protein
MRVRTSSWSLEPMAGWTLGKDPVCVSLTRGPAGGALHVHSTAENARPVTLANLQDVTNRIAAGRSAPTVVEFGSFHGYSISYMEGDSYCRQFLLANDNIIVFAAYNGPPHARTSEEPEVEAMLRTLRREAPAA